MIKSNVKIKNNIRIGYFQMTILNKEVHYLLGFFGFFFHVHISSKIG